MRPILILLVVMLLVGCGSSSPSEPTADQDRIQAETNQPENAPTTGQNDNPSTNDPPPADEPEPSPDDPPPDEPPPSEI